MSFSALVDASSGQETRTISAPAFSSAWICATVALTSEVSVFVIDCTEMGASPPTITLPTLTVRDFRRWICRYGLGSYDISVVSHHPSARLLQGFRRQLHAAD